MSYVDDLLKNFDKFFLTGNTESINAYLSDFDERFEEPISDLSLREQVKGVVANLFLYVAKWRKEPKQDDVNPFLLQKYLYVNALYICMKDRFGESSEKMKAYEIKSL